MRHRALIPTFVIAAAAVSLLTTGCGGSSTTAATTTSSASNGAFAYARCMRSHGVTNFPDPSTGGGIDKQAVVSALQAVGHSKADAAQTACIHVNGGSPGTGQSASATQSQARTSAMLAFARCLRRRGLANFPDPTPSGQLTREMIANSGINLHQPAVAQVADACVNVTHGVITKAVVARFLAGQ